MCPLGHGLGDPVSVLAGETTALQQGVYASTALLKHSDYHLEPVTAA